MICWTISEVPYNSDDSNHLDTPPIPTKQSRISPERRQYLEDLRAIEDECEAELDSELIIWLQYHRSAYYYVKEEVYAEEVRVPE